MVPLVYVLLAVFQVQRAAFGVTEAARQAGRAFVTAGSDRRGARARAAQLALADQGVTAPTVVARPTCPAAGERGDLRRQLESCSCSGVDALLPAGRGRFAVTGRSSAPRRFAS